MRKPAMMREAHHRPFEAPEHVQVRSFGGEGHGRGSQRRLAVESCPGQNRAGQKMSDGFQVKVLTQMRAG